jgi:hypothetical protein
VNRPEHWIAYIMHGLNYVSCGLLEVQVQYWPEAPHCLKTQARSCCVMFVWSGWTSSIAQLAHLGCCWQSLATWSGSTRSAEQSVGLGLRAAWDTYVFLGTTYGALSADVSNGLLCKVSLPENMFKMLGFTRGTRAALGFHTPGSWCKAPECLHEASMTVHSLISWTLQLEPYSIHSYNIYSNNIQWNIIITKLTDLGRLGLYRWCWTALRRGLPHRSILKSIVWLWKCWKHLSGLMHVWWFCAGRPAADQPARLVFYGPTLRFIHWSLA